MGLLSLILYGVLTFIVLLGTCIAFLLKRREIYYKKQGIPYLGVGFTKTLRMFAGVLNFIDLEAEVYKEAKATKAPIVAVSDITGQSSLIVMEPEIIKRIMVKDFDHFVNPRSFNVQNSSKYFTKMLFVMRDEQWKASRIKMTPAFTTGKIKKMFQLFLSSSEKMDAYLKQQMNYPQRKSVDVDFSKVLFKYLMNVIASSAFGIDSQSWETEMNKFSTFEKFGKLFEARFDVKDFLKVIVIVMAPKLADMLDLDILNYKAQNYFENVVKNVLKHRRQTGGRCNDFLQLMIDIQQGTLKNDDDDNETKSTEPSNHSADKLVFDDDYVVANALLFFLAGFDTSYSGLVFSIYSITVEQGVQEKLYNEVKTAVDKYEGKICYEALSEMPFLDMVIQETMRLYPAATRSERECTTDYIVEETGFKIEKGTLILMPIHGIHTDSKFYPDPEKFIPERFSADNKAARHQYTYLPFGHGPRSCIGSRFALLNIKTVVAQLVSSYKFDVCSKTQVPVKLDDSMSAKPSEGMWLNITTRDN